MALLYVTVHVSDIFIIVRASRKLEINCARTIYLNFSLRYACSKNKQSFSVNKLSRRWTVTRSVGVVNVVHIEGGFGLRLDSGFALSELVLSVAEVVEGLPRMT